MKLIVGLHFLPTKSQKPIFLTAVRVPSAFKINSIHDTTITINFAGKGLVVIYLLVGFQKLNIREEFHRTDWHICKEP